jgi:hypothetical protein
MTLHHRALAEIPATPNPGIVGVVTLHDGASLLLALLKIPFILFCAYRAARLSYDAFDSEDLITLRMPPPQRLLQCAVRLFGCDGPLAAADFDIRLS